MNFDCRASQGGGFANWSLGLGIFALGWLLLAAAMPVLADHMAISLTISLCYAAALVAVAVQAIRLDQPAGAARWMLAGAYGAGAVVLAARAIAILTEPVSHPGLFLQSTLHTLAFLTLFAMSCAGSMAFLLMLREQASVEIRHMAMFDPLTDLFNRRAFMELAERELARSRRARAPFAVLMMDLDLFKRVNDEFGHQAGDRVLADFAAIVKRSVRAEDLVGRYGGEEFCAVLPGTGMAKALEIADRIRSSVAERPLAGLPRATTVSIGAVICTHDTPSLDAAIARADKALYRAKNEGRNRVVGLDFVSEEKFSRLAVVASH